MYTVVWLEWKKLARDSAFLSCQEYSSYPTDILLDDFSYTSINKNNDINNNIGTLHDSLSYQKKIACIFSHDED